MTIHEFLDTCGQAPLDEILACGMHRDTGRLVQVKRFDVEHWLRAAGIVVPDSYDTSLLLARHLVEIEQEKRKTNFSQDRLDRLTLKKDRAVAFWTSNERGFHSPHAEHTAATKAQAKGADKYRLPLKFGPEHPCHKKSTAKVRGQAALVRDLFADKTMQMTAQEATDRLVAAGFTCNQPPFKAIYFVLNDWKKKGWLRID